MNLGFEPLDLGCKGFSETSHFHSYKESCSTRPLVERQEEEGEGKKWRYHCLMILAPPGAGSRLPWLDYLWCRPEWARRYKTQLQDHTYLKEVSWSKSKDFEGRFQHAFFRKVIVWIKYKISFDFGWDQVKGWKRNWFGKLIALGEFLEIHDSWKLRFFQSFFH